jgi:hypothetical protein
MRYHVTFQGVFSQFNSGSLELNFPEAVKVEQLLEEICDVLGRLYQQQAAAIEEAVAVSAIADETRILAKADRVTTEYIHLLPPVNGG